MKKSILIMSGGIGMMLMQTAHAYMGPGSGLGAIGTLIALIGAVLFAIVGFVWYPVKRLLKSRKSKSEQSE